MVCRDASCSCAPSTTRRVTRRGRSSCCAASTRRGRPSCCCVSKDTDTGSVASAGCRCALAATGTKTSSGKRAPKKSSIGDDSESDDTTLRSPSTPSCGTGPSRSGAPPPPAPLLDPAPILGSSRRRSRRRSSRRRSCSRRRSSDRRSSDRRSSRRSPRDRPPATREVEEEEDSWPIPSRISRPRADQSSTESLWLRRPSSHASSSPKNRWALSRFMMIGFPEQRTEARCSPSSGRKKQTKFFVQQDRDRRQCRRFDFWRGCFLSRRGIIGRGRINGSHSAALTIS